MSITFALVDIILQNKICFGARKIDLYVVYSDIAVHDA
jgi:hypothetical protein